MSASQNNISHSINQQDSNGVNILNRLLTATYAGAVGQFTDGILTGTGATTFTLPIASVLQFAFNNTHATANITLNLTGATGTALLKVPPGGIVTIWATATGPSGSITAMTGTADLPNATYQCFLGG
jgi:hypothetical protein